MAAKLRIACAMALARVVLVVIALAMTSALLEQVLETTPSRIQKLGRSVATDLLGRAAL